MNQNLKDYRKKKHQFKSYYCTGCRQAKPCHLLTSSDKEWKGYCCQCYYQNRQYWAQKHLDYELAYQKKLVENQERIQQLKLLRSYQGCADCGSKEVDGYHLYQENELICWSCLMNKTGGASSSISFSEQQKWFKKRWGIDINWWLDTYNCLPIDHHCAKQWQDDNQHLPENCDCLKKQVNELHHHWLERISTIKNQLENECQCEVSSKVRVGDDNYAWCENCGQTIIVASKKRVIKNRNDPKFWGLKIEQKILCLNCLANYQDQMMPLRKKFLFNEYQKRGYGEK